MKKGIIVILVVVFISSLVSCSALEGTYYGQKGMLVDSIVFKDGYATFTAFGMVTGSFPYTVKGSSLYIKDPTKGDVRFTIIDNKTISTDVFGLAGTYIKK